MVSLDTIWYLLAIGLSIRIITSAWWRKLVATGHRLFVTPLLQEPTWFPFFRLLATWKQTLELSPTIYFPVILFITKSLTVILDGKFHCRFMNSLPRLVLRVTLNLRSKFDVHLHTKPALVTQTVKPAVKQFSQSTRCFCNMPEKKPFERLPKNVVPQNYALTLKPDLKAFTFEGSEEISIEVGPNI